MTVSMGVEALKLRLQQAEKDLDKAIQRRERCQTELTDATSMERSRQAYRDQLYADLLVLQQAIEGDPLRMLEATG